MNLLDSLTGGNPLSMLSDAAEAACDALLPKNLEFIGDIVGGAIDVGTENYPKLLADFEDFTKDLPQQLGGLSDGTQRALSALTEPSTPPASGDATKADATNAKGTTADDFFKLSDQDLLEALAHGQLPESVSGDPGKMQALQARVNLITEMNQLITTMLKALHDMQMSTIQNIRA